MSSAWVLVSNGTSQAVFTDPFRAIEFCADPDEPINWTRAIGVFQGRINGKVKYWLTAVPFDPTPPIMTRQDSDWRARFVADIRTDSLTQKLIDKYGGEHEPDPEVHEAS